MCIYSTRESIMFISSAQISTCLYICGSHKYMQQQNIPRCHTIHISCQRAPQKTHRFFCKIHIEHLKKGFPPSSGGGKYPEGTHHDLALHNQIELHLQYNFKISNSNSSEEIATETRTLSFSQDKYKS